MPNTEPDRLAADGGSPGTDATPEERVDPRRDGERLVFFSDAVIAIAMTLLALDLPLPAGTTNSELWHGLGEGRDEYLAFLISFLVIGSHWSSHHRLMREVRIGGRLMTWNMLWLLMIVLTPFATRVITGDGAFAARFTIYASVQALAGLAHLLVVRELDRGDLLGHDDAAAAIRSGYARASTVLITFAVSIPIGWFTHWAFACWVVLPRVLTLRTRPYPRHAGGRTAGETREPAAPGVAADQP